MRRRRPRLRPRRPASAGSGARLRLLAGRVQSRAGGALWERCVLGCMLLFVVSVRWIPLDSGPVGVFGPDRPSHVGAEAAVAAAAADAPAVVHSSRKGSAGRRSRGSHLPGGVLAATAQASRVVRTVGLRTVARFTSGLRGG